ncbi:MAG: beta-ketoacyl-ACP synthase III [Flavobacteriales bacterium]|nr:MAG: beta-ketoacyl-ACP synthase III [Flavobacteriales bacterium]
MKDVYITRVSGFLPHAPVTNEEMEARLGLVDGKTSRARAIVLRNNGIVKRYYAMDAHGKATHTNAALAAEAVKRLAHGGVRVEDFEVLACGTSAPDQLLPSHASQVHGLLPHALEIISPSGACASGMHAFKFGYMSVATGCSRNAVTTGSELISPMMRSVNFEAETERFRQLDQDPIIGFEKEFLRWMLSDGAGAALLEDAPRGECDLKVEWVDSRSFANELQVCMYLGGDLDENGELVGWKVSPPEDFAGKALFTFKQDVKALGKYVVPVGTKYLVEVLAKHGVDSRSIDFVLPHVSSNFFKQKLHDEFVAQGIPMAWDRWFMNLTEVGNVGSASIYLMLDELVRSGRLRKGHRILLVVPESARFSYSFAFLTVV